jgi:glucosamine--fructose-6-phosphate aminotransferase (isomerizing)
MCGIAGFSLGPDSRVERTLAVQALLAGIAERGADAVGYAHRMPGAGVSVTKLRGGATSLLDSLALPPEADTALIHVRDFTKGGPEVNANNHPIRHGAVVGIHNGVIENDEDILARYRLRRAEPEMTVDSEAIFALVHHVGPDHRALSELRGTMAAAWLDERTPDCLYLARGSSRPLWVGQTPSETFFASTRRALAIAEAALGLSLHARPMREGRVLKIAGGRIVRKRRFRPSRPDRVETPYSPVHSPHEAVSCLVRFAALASPSV